MLGSFPVAQRRVPDAPLDKAGDNRLEDGPKFSMAIRVPIPGIHDQMVIRDHAHIAIMPPDTMQPEGERVWFASDSLSAIFHDFIVADRVVRFGMAFELPIGHRAGALLLLGVGWPEGAAQRTQLWPIGERFKIRWAVSDHSRVHKRGVLGERRVRLGVEEG